MSIFNRVFGDPNERELKRLRPLVNHINELADEMRKLDGDELRGMTAELKQELENGASLDDILPEAFAVVRETSDRVLGMRHFDEQLIGGIVLHQGRIAEMRTGEGKTLLATLPSYLNALTGQGCMSSPSTTTSPSVTATGWAASTSSWVSPSASF